MRDMSASQMDLSNFVIIKARLGDEVRKVAIQVPLFLLSRITCWWNVRVAFCRTLI